MRDLVADGWSARQAADRVRSQDAAGQAVIDATAPADAVIDGSPDGSIDGSIDGSPDRSTDVGTADATELLSAAADLTPHGSRRSSTTGSAVGPSRRSSTSG